MSSSTIQAALETVAQPDETPLETLEAKRTDLEAAINDLLSPEIELKKELKAQLAGVDTQIKQQGRQLPRLSSEILTWRRQKILRATMFNFDTIQVPSLAVLSVDSTALQFTKEWHGRAMKKDGLPQSLGDFYKDVDSELQEACAGHRGLDGRDRLESVALSWALRGAIPAEARALIREHKGKFRDGIALVADAPPETWRITSVEMPPRPIFDPLIVGVEGETLWLLGEFDPTPIEEYVAREFTS